MATVSIPNSFTNGTAADADEVNQNFSALRDFANNSTVHVDGSKAFTSNIDAGSNKIVNVTAPTADTDGANKAYVDAVIPVGTIVPYAGSTAPSGWLFADGSNVSRTTYADLYAVIGTTYGPGDGSETFTLPNTDNRFLAGLGSASWSNALNETGGSATQVLMNEAGTGSVSVNLQTGGPVSRYFTPLTSLSVDIGSTTSSTDTHSHTTSGTAAAPDGAVAATNQNLPPYLTVNFIIRF